MNSNGPPDIDAVWRAESRRVLATLLRLLGDFDRAEEALNDAFLAAAEQWPHAGIPANPRSWLVSAGRFKAIDRMRRRIRFDAIVRDLAVADEEVDVGPEDQHIGDDQLRLIFVCCHPELSPDAQIALTLREACGLTTEEIAAAFLTRPATIAQRIVRAKVRIKELGLAYEVPAPGELQPRLDSVLRTIYLIFNEGYAASHGAHAIRAELCAEAIRLARLLRDLLRTTEPELEGLLALMLIHHARHEARSDAEGQMILLADQDRSLWNRPQIDEGVAILERSMRQPPMTGYLIEAAIAAQHALAPSASATDWNEIVRLYDLLMRADPTPVVALNRAVAISMRDGPEAGLAEIERLLAAGALDGFRYAHAARADLLRRIGRKDAARERNFIKRRLAELAD